MLDALPERVGAAPERGQPERHVLEGTIRRLLFARGAFGSRSRPTAADRERVKPTEPDGGAVR